MTVPTSQELTFTALLDALVAQADAHIAEAKAHCDEQIAHWRRVKLGAAQLRVAGMPHLHAVKELEDDVA